MKKKIDLQTLISAAKSKTLDLAIHGQLVPQNPDDELLLFFWSVSEQRKKNSSSRQNQT